MKSTTSVNLVNLKFGRDVDCFSGRIRSLFKSDGKATMENFRHCDFVSNWNLLTCEIYFERCDRGILIGGGWNRLHSTYQSWDNMVKMESVLRANGFLRDNLKMFYGDGYEREERNEDVGKVSTRFHSLALKIELRKHLSKICGTKHCADTVRFKLNIFANYNILNKILIPLLTVIYLSQSTFNNGR